jgi:hypothetical protein
MTALQQDDSKYSMYHGSKHICGRRNSSVGIAVYTGCTAGGSIPGRVKRFIYLPHSAQITSGAHPAPYPMGAGGSFPEGKAAGA